jgi:hypothetical protein
MLALSSPQILVGGRWLSSLATWGDLTITHRWPYGCWEAQWKMALKPYQRPPALVAGADVEVRLGSGAIWAGDLPDLDWDSGTMTAVGAARQGETSLCLTSGGDTTSTPDTAVDEASARGAVQWARRVSLSSSAFAPTDETANLNYLTALLDAWSTSQSKRWGVNAAREVYAAADPTTPALYVRPGAGVLGVTEETQAARIFGRYLNTSGAYATVNVGSGTPEVGVLLESHGPIDSTTATNIITGMRAQLQASTAWTNGVTVTAEQVTTPGGQRLSLDQVTAGKMARLLGLRDERGAEASTDIVLGETVWDVSAGTVVCNPVGLSDRSLSGVVEAGGGELL